MIKHLQLGEISNGAFEIISDTLLKTIQKRFVKIAFT